jgi:hypothetical protein
LVGVTGDPKQDARLTQHFITKENEWWNDNHVQPKKEPIMRSHAHSDNCAGHFKSAEQMNFLSRMTILFVWLLIATWDFGCPGHGKGIWDGFGAVLKRMLRQDTVDGTVETESGTENGDSLLITCCTVLTSPLFFPRCGCLETLIAKCVQARS